MPDPTMQVEEEITTNFKITEGVVVIRGRHNNWRDRQDLQASVAVKPDWEVVVDMDLKKLSMGITNTDTPKSAEDLLWCGHLDRYNDVYEKCSTRTPAVLKTYRNREFYPVSTY